MRVTDWPGSIFPSLRSTKDRFIEKNTNGGNGSKTFGLF